MPQVVEVPDVKVKRVTEKALLCVIPGDEVTEVWVPKSIIHEDSEVQEEHDEGTLVVPMWWAKKTDELSEYVD